MTPADRQKALDKIAYDLSFEYFDAVADPDKRFQPDLAKYIMRGMEACLSEPAQVKPDAIESLRSYYLPQLKFKMDGHRKFATEHPKAADHHHGAANALEVAIGCIEEALTSSPQVSAPITLNAEDFSSFQDELNNPAQPNDNLRELVSAQTKGEKPFEDRVHDWMLECFGIDISADKMERNHRFLEESLELVQANGCTQSEAHQLVDYVFGRPIGELYQECGGVMVTLAALCNASDLGMAACGEAELRRVWTKIEKIRAKQAAKPKHSPLPAALSAQTGDMTLPDYAEMARQEQEKSDQSEDITPAIYHNDQANNLRTIANLVGTLKYIAVQAKAAHPGALKVIQMNAESAIDKIQGAKNG